ncbi:MAG: TonB family protein [Ignavibacteria bacterium]|nr:TonB family protein [Ignavibacteria bacterium]
MFSINFEPKNQSDLLFRILIISFLFLIIPEGIIAQNGVIKSYYPDRTLKSELSYVNDILDGPAKYYHENGKVKLEKSYSRGILNGWVREYFANGSLREEYFVKTGVLDGDKKEFTQSGQLLKIFSYTDGILINRQNFDAEYTPAIVAKAEVAKPEVVKEIVAEKAKPVEIKEDVFTQAYPVEGIEAIQEKIVYPEHAQKFGLEGTVYLLVTIDESGKPVKSIITKGIGLGCDEAAIDVVKQSKFVASTKNGVPVQSDLPITLEFKLPKVKEAIAEVKQEEKTVAESKPAR